MSNGLDSSSVGPDLGPIVCNCYQKATKVPASKERVKKNIDWGLDMRHTSDLFSFPYILSASYSERRFF